MARPRVRKRDTEGEADRRLLLSELSEPALLRHTEKISAFVRMPGSVEESESLDYVRAQLLASGFDDVRTYHVPFEGRQTVMSA